MELPDGAWDRRKELTSGEYELYQALCKFRCRDKNSENFGLAFPNRDTLSTELSMVKEYVSQITSALVRKGWIAKIGWKIRLIVGFEKLDNSYKLESEKVRIEPAKSKNSQGQKLENDLSHIKDLEPIEPEEPVKEIHVELIPAPDDIQVFDFWKVHMKHPRSQLDAKRQKNVKARLKDGYSVEDLCNAVRGCKLSAFHMGDNKQGKKFDDLELICRDGPKVDGFITTFEEPPIQTTNGANGNGQNGAAKSKFAADSEQRAESFVKSVSYFDRRVEAAYRAADSTEALVKRTSDPTGPD